MPIWPICRRVGLEIISSPWTGAHPVSRSLSSASVSVMTPDMLADIKNHKKMDVRVMVRSMGSRDTGIVFMDAIVNHIKCTADKVAVELAMDGKVYLHAPADVIVRDGGPFSESDPIYLRWVREYNAQNKKRRVSETLPTEKKVGSGDACGIISHMRWSVP